ncbi:major facilitator superfamily domain-containing protein [Lactarius quietus]|nr:major facilitator superfamily domain-containing protein [Lactarius quietus]
MYSESDEETPLLRNGNQPRKETPLPITQILVLLLLQLSESMMSSSIKPYINQLISELPIAAGDEKKVGYYAGLIVSLYFAAQVVSVFQWSRLSDKVGRKPVFLCGLLGTIVSSLLFGLSRSFSALVFSRFLNGLLNGNAGVVKSMMAELTDETNVARVVSLIPVVWAVGGTLGPFIGGVLSRPQDRWPNAFSHPFWGEFPYFLPCLATSSFVVVTFILAVVFLEETVNVDPAMKHNTEASTGLSQVGDGDILDGPLNGKEKPLALRALLTRPVVVSVANYGVISLHDIMAGALIPLIWSTSIDFGGLGMSPACIGLWIAGYGFLNGILQFVAFPPIVRRFGPRNVFIASILFFVPLYVLFPFENLVLLHSHNGLNRTAALLIVLQLTATAFTDMGFGAVFMYISSAPPNKRSLGATNGIAQTMASIQRTIGPAASASLFAFSLNGNIWGGNFVYAVLLGFVLAGLGVAVQLPRKTWSQTTH